MPEESSALPGTKIKGGCHCGHVKYECIADPDPKTGQLQINRCNCTLCTKRATTNLYGVKPENFKLLSPSRETMEGITNYETKNNKTITKYFCSTCGCHMWMEGVCEYPGGSFPVFIVNLTTADQPQEGLEFHKVKIGYWDGLHDNLSAGPRDVPWPGGLI